MKSNFISRSWKTLLLLLIAVIIIAYPLAVKSMTAETLMPFMFLIGFFLLFYAILSPWGKPMYFIILTAISTVLFIILFMGGFDILVKLTPKVKSDGDLIWSVGVAFVSGIIAGFAGILTCSKGWQRLVYSGATLSFLAITILYTCLDPPNLKNSIRIGIWIALGLQLISIAVLIYIGNNDKKNSRFSKISLLYTAIILIIISLTAFLVARGVKGQRFDFWNFSLRIFAVIEVIIAGITIIALNKAGIKRNG